MRKKKEKKNSFRQLPVVESRFRYVVVNKELSSLVPDRIHNFSALRAIPNMYL